MGLISKIINKIHNKVMGERYKRYLKISDTVITKRMQQKKLIIVTESIFKNPQQLRGLGKQNLPIFFEKEVLFNNDSTGKYLNLYYIVNGTDRTVGHTYTLALSAIQNDCIIVVSKDEDIRHFKNEMMEIIYKKIMDHKTPFTTFYKMIQGLYIVNDIETRIIEIKSKIDNL